MIGIAPKHVCIQSEDADYPEFPKTEYVRIDLYDAVCRERDELRERVGRHEKALELADIIADRLAGSICWVDQEIKAYEAIRSKVPE